MRVHKQTFIHGLGKSLFEGVPLFSLKRISSTNNKMEKNGVKQNQKNFPVIDAVCKTVFLSLQDKIENQGKRNKILSC